VAHHDRRNAAAGGTVVAVHVAAANSAGRHFDQSSPGPGVGVGSSAISRCRYLERSIAFIEMSGALPFF